MQAMLKVALGILFCFWLAPALGISLNPIITSGLNAPTFLASPPDDSRLFVAERSGAIKVFSADGDFLATFITIADVDTTNEGGLLGLAFHPDYASNGYFFVSYTATLGGQFSTVIARYSVSPDPNIASMAPPKTILTVAQPATNHNAGWIGFSPVDGYLYIPLGDGGGGHDTYNNGQDINTLLGSILRLDVDTPPAVPYTSPSTNPFVNQAGRDEIWAYGVRNPWRAGFDRATGELYFGDVGQNSWEEVNRGEREGNFGWPLREGLVATPTGGVGGDLSPRADPLHVYPNPAVGRSIVGGTVYRGPVLALQGKYLFAEFYSGEIWHMATDGSAVTPISNILSYSGTPIAFGEGHNGDLYLVDFGGSVYRFAGEIASDSAKKVPALSWLVSLFGVVMLMLLAFKKLAAKQLKNHAQ